MDDGLSNYESYSRKATAYRYVNDNHYCVNYELDAVTYCWVKEVSCTTEQEWEQQYTKFCALADSLGTPEEGEYDIKLSSEGDVL